DDDVEERVGKTLHKWQMEDSSRARRFIAKSIKSSESEDEVYNEGGDDVAVEDGDGDDDVVEETAGEKRKRVAEAYLEKMREMARREI
nr:transducin/WD40 repeat-like superfamily protein [Tanacetum cinerariifolium]